MTDLEAIEKLKALDGDPERSHSQAEEIIDAFLRSHNFSSVAEAFNRARDRIGFWYA